MNKQPEILIKTSVKRPLIFTLLAASFALGVFVGAGVGMFSTAPSTKDESTFWNAEGKFRFIRGSIETSARRDKHATKELKPFQYKVNALIDKMQKGGEASTISIYFLDLNSGNWFGVGERDTFSSRHLLKVPLMIAYFKWAESRPLVLRKTYTFVARNHRPAEASEDQLKRLKPGNAYTVNDLIFRMIAHDDGDAYSLLFANLPPGRLEKVFNDLDVEYDPKKKEDTLSLNAFASFFRVLYNASYLSEEMSEKALRYLSKSSFRDGMVAGITPNVDIASKFGERKVPVTIDGETTILTQIHEFGVIYHPSRPFLVGIMVRGGQTEQLSHIIRDITHLVYQEVDAQS